MIVWQESVKLFEFVKRKLDTLKTVSFKVKAQIEDSAFSVSSNIAEGYCRRYLKENIQYNTIALSSLGENYSQLFTLFYSGVIEEEWFNEFDNMHYSVENKLIKLNKKSIENLMNNYDWKNDCQIKDIIEKYNDL